MRITAHPYGVEVLLVTTAETLKRASMRFKCEVPTDMAGCVLRPDSGPLIVAVLDGQRSTLVHELGHAALFILETVGINPTDSLGETYCYLLEYLYARLEKHITVS